MVNLGSRLFTSLIIREETIFINSFKILFFNQNIYRYTKNNYFLCYAFSTINFVNNFMIVMLELKLLLFPSILFFFFILFLNFCYLLVLAGPLMLLRVRQYYEIPKCSLFFPSRDFKNVKKQS